MFANVNFLIIEFIYCQKSNFVDDGYLITSLENMETDHNSIEGELSTNHTDVTPSIITRNLERIDEKSLNCETNEEDNNNDIFVQNDTIWKSINPARGVFKMHSKQNNIFIILLFLLISLFLEC